MRLPAVSVVIPAYNNGAHIEATIRSVLNQTFQDIELIISDHASTDDTVAIVRSFLSDKRVRLESIGAGGGAWRNWNHVSSLARGEYVKLVCGDDLLHPDCIERQVQAFKDHAPGVVLVASRRDIVDANGRTVVRCQGLGRLSGRVDGQSASRAAVRSGTNIFGEPCCVLIRRGVLAETGFWEGADGYVIDLATYLKILQKGDLVAMRDSLACFRVSAEQWSVQLRSEQESQVHALRRRVDQNGEIALSRRDLVQGAFMTKAHAWKRRLAYRVLGRRMRSE